MYAGRTYVAYDVARGSLGCAARVDPYRMAAAQGARLPAPQWPRRVGLLRRHLGRPSRGATGDLASASAAGAPDPGSGDLSAGGDDAKWAAALRAGVGLGHIVALYRRSFSPHKIR
jgi:hypothetical protein